MRSDGVDYHRSDAKKKLSAFTSWYAANNLSKNESELLKPLTEEMLGSSFKILVCG